MDTSCVLSVLFYRARVMMARLQMKFVFVFNALLYISLLLCLGGKQVRLFLNFDNLRFFLAVIRANAPKIDHAPDECMIV